MHIFTTVGRYLNSCIVYIFFFKSLCLYCIRCQYLCENMGIEIIAYDQFPGGRWKSMASDCITGPMPWFWIIMMTSSNGNVSALVDLGAGNPRVTGEFPSQRPETRSLDVFFDPRLNKRLSKQSRRRGFETTSCSLWRHCDIHKSLWCQNEVNPRCAIEIFSDKIWYLNRCEISGTHRMIHYLSWETILVTSDVIRQWF